MSNLIKECLFIFEGSSLASEVLNYLSAYLQEINSSLENVFAQFKDPDLLPLDWRDRTVEEDSSSNGKEFSGYKTEKFIYIVRFACKDSKNPLDTKLDREFPIKVDAENRPESACIATIHAISCMEAFGILAKWLKTNSLQLEQYQFVCSWKS